MRKRKNKEDDGVDMSSPAWMTTYGDMMTLLLCFFVLLFSFSVIDVDKFERVMQALKDKLGVLNGGKTLNQSVMIDRGLVDDSFSTSSLDQNQFDELIQELENHILEANLESEVTLEESERGLVIRMTGKVLFDLGKAGLKSGGQEVLSNLATFLEGIPNYLEIEGHTDDLPINNDEFPNNWALSATRSLNVCNYLMENTKIDPQRLQVKAHGPYKPIMPNDSPENRAMNRRVDIVILRNYLDVENAVGEENNE
ncbi:MAG: OmpA family protein [Halanaerobiales bacterium]|nr:OmpA family protein [Halanaerobiales bacterium]